MNTWFWMVWLWWSGWLALAGVRASDYYVSPAGDDAHDGRGPEPARAFRTVQRGVEALHAGDRLLVRAGTYRETVTFNRDGEPGAPIVVMAYPGEQPVISGLEPLTDWTASGNDRWTTSMPWTLGRGKDQLFVNGAPLLEARFPNAAAPGLALHDDNGVELPPPWPRFGAFSIPDPTKPFEVRLPSGENCPVGWWDGAIYLGQHWDGWQVQCGLVEASGGDRLTVKTELQGWWYPRAQVGAGHTDDGRGMLVGHIHAMDVAGEWVRTADGTVTLQQPAGTAPSAIEAKRRFLAFELSDRRHVTVRGFRVLGASACLRDAHACVLQGCTFEWSSHYTWFAGVTGDIDHPGTFDPMYRGETGLYVSGSVNTVRDCTFHGGAGSAVTLDGYEQTLHNNLVELVGYAGTYQPAVCVWGEQNRIGGAHRITRNTLKHASRSLLWIRGIYQNSPARLPLPYAASLIEGNHLHTGMLMARDGGVVYSWMSNGGAWNGVRTVFRHNVLYDSRDPRNVALFYFDNGCWYYDVRENVTWSPPDTPVQRAHFFYAPSLGTTWENNTFFPASAKHAATLAPADFPGGIPFAFGHDFTHPPAVPDRLPVREFVISPARTLARSSRVVRDGAVLSGWRDGDWASYALPEVARWQTVIVFADFADGSANLSRQWPAEPRHTQLADPLVLAMAVAEERSSTVSVDQQCAAGLRDGAWLRFRSVPLGAGFRQIRLWYASNTPVVKRAELRLDRLDGPVVATIPLTDASGTPQPPSEMLAPEIETVAPVASTATGTHDLWLVFAGEGSADLGPGVPSEPRRQSRRAARGGGRDEARSSRPRQGRAGARQPLPGLSRWPARTVGGKAGNGQRLA